MLDSFSSPVPGRINRAGLNNFCPTASNGCSYQMDDAPGFANVIRGRAHILNFTFQGVLIDVRSGVRMASNIWSVAGEFR